MAKMQKTKYTLQEGEKLSIAEFDRGMRDLKPLESRTPKGRKKFSPRPPVAMTTKIITTAEITPNYMKGMAEHIRNVEENWTPPTQKYAF